MKTKNLILYSLLLTGISLTCFYACKKKETTEPVRGCTDPNATNYNPNATESDGSCQYTPATTTDNNVTAASNSMKMTSEDMIIYNYSSYEGDNTLGKTLSIGDSVPLPSCAVVTLNPAFPDTTFPKTLTIDFGSGCLCKDGKMRKGKIITTFNNRWKNRVIGDSLVVDLNNYYVNDTMIKGRRIYTLNNSTLIPKTLDISFRTENAGIVYPNMDSVSWNASGNFNAYLGYTFSDYQDDVYKLYFTGTVKGKSGTPYTVTTSDTLLSQLNCISKCGFIGGKLEASMTTQKDTTIATVKITVDVITTVVVDFGASKMCDDQLSYYTNVKMVNVANSNVIYNQSTATTTKTCSGFSK